MAMITTANLLSEMRRRGPNSLAWAFGQLVEFVRSHSTDDVDALIASGTFQAHFPAIEEAPSNGNLVRWKNRPAAVPGDPRNAVLAQSNTEYLKSSKVAGTAKSRVAVEPRAGGRWAVQTDGAQRADSLHDTKTDAVRRARELAGNKATQLVIKDEKGRVVGEDSDGADPRRIKG